ncbi:TraR/DksA C4-type zinc finger protein [Clostridium peptidivorans]|uniref:TraR/DksA C4-type zinc finger protein n=1 Tax=Clostridium peptidivorans TaxID=100174 RepID=UPI000BE226BD|nr:TraR/DksA C4-type zinc finger protein [Clostridium peptidivorans]
MDKSKLDYFKKKLEKEKNNVIETLHLMKRNDTIDSNVSFLTELSLYDNHPSDMASEVYDKERGLALKGNEVNILNKINDALNRIEDRTYGKCQECGKDINEERLEFIPYAECCVNCQRHNHSGFNVKLDSRAFQPKNRPIEEKVIQNFDYTINDYDEAAFDGMDSYDDVGFFNKRENIFEDDYYEDHEGIVDIIDTISNEQYRKTIE